MKTKGSQLSAAKLICMTLKFIDKNYFHRIWNGEKNYRHQQTQETKEKRNKENH